MELVSIILINFNGLKDLGGCLESVKAQEHLPIEFLALDNHSTDGSADFLEKFCSEDESRRRFALPPRLIRNKTNLGFSRALNLGIRETQGRYVMPLNTDIVLKPDFVSKLVSAIEETGAGSASGKLLRFSRFGEKEVIDSAGHVIFKNRLAQNRGEGEIASSSYLAREPVFGTCGAAALYLREMLEDIRVGREYFDEDFFAFWEDVDVDWRARMRGWECIYEPEAVAWHRRGGAGYRKSLLVEYHNYKNRYLMILKNDTPFYFSKNLPGILLTEVLKAGALLLRCPRALLSLFEVARLFPTTLEKRRIIQARRTTSAKELDCWFAPFGYQKWIRRHLFQREEMKSEGDSKEG